MNADHQRMHDASGAIEEALSAFGASGRVIGGQATGGATRYTWQGAAATDSQLTAALQDLFGPGTTWTMEIKVTVPNRAALEGAGTWAITESKSTR